MAVALLYLRRHQTIDRHILQSDFDRIAQCSSDRWDHNIQSHRFLLEHVPPQCADALDIGCGTGSFTRLLARRSDHVLALDLSPEMIRIARERSHDYGNINYQVADVLIWECEPEAFDCIASIATLHHLPIEETLIKLKRALRPNGALLILDLYRGTGAVDPLLSLVIFPLSVVLKAVHNRRLRAPREERKAWAHHGRHDAYPTLSQVRRASASILPGAMVRRHLFWRYSLVWRNRPTSAPS